MCYLDELTEVVLLGLWLGLVLGLVFDGCGSSCTISVVAATCW